MRLLTGFGGRGSGIGTLGSLVTLDLRLEPHTLTHKFSEAAASLPETDPRSPIPTRIF